MSFEGLVVCLRDRSITARHQADYWAIADMAHGAAVALAGVALTACASHDLERVHFLEAVCDAATALSTEDK